MKVWVSGLTAAVLLGGALALGVATQDDGRLAPGLRVGGVSVGGLTRAQAQAALQDLSATPRQVTVQAQGRTWTLSADRLGWRVDPASSVAAAVQAGRDRGVLERVQALVGQAPVQNLSPVERVDAAEALSTLGALTGELQTPPREASVTFDRTLKRYAVLPATPGRRVGTAAAVNVYAANPSLTTLKVPVTEWKANRDVAALRAQVERGNRLMREFTVGLEGQDRAVALTPLQVADLYWVRDTGIVPDEKTLKATFDRLVTSMDQPAQNARFSERTGKRVRVPEQPGFVTDRKAAFALFRQTVLDPQTQTVTFPGKVSRPTLTVAALPNPDRLHLITTGVSTYYHSSPERRVNIANAAAKVSGMVVAPGEDFSFLQALGGITPENGFVGGLIISGGRTVDGLGGGVCQVSTTVFRALYQAGLPVVERNPHSYRVGYYEPQVGFEAAVYDPGLDLKMKNDTGGPLYIRTVNDDAASRLEVQVWGVKMNRKVTVNPAVILSRVAHPRAQYVVNPRLSPGAVKQVDWAQDGFDLYISRTIRDGQGVRTDRVETVYKPWRAVYEVGPG